MSVQPSRSTCAICGHPHRSMGDICGLCRRFDNDQPDEDDALTGGEWVKKGAVLVWVEHVEPETETPNTIECGTRRGYREHLKLGEKTCAKCRAHNAADRAQRRIEKAQREYAEKVRRETKSTTRLAAELWLIELQREERVAA